MTQRWTDADLEQAYRAGYSDGDFQRSGNVERDWQDSEIRTTIERARREARRAENRG